MNSSKLYQTIGIDVGGANLKLATTSGAAAASSFALWREAAELHHEVRRVMQVIGTCSTLAVTITGELCDCFQTRQEGIWTILSHLESVVPAESIRVFSIGGQWLDVQAAKAHSWDVAASNWYALAQWLCHYPTSRDLCRSAVVLDIGSTTVDIIPVRNQTVATAARTDRDRLIAGQLVYTGIQRTPVCAILPSAVIDGVTVPLMAELFATSDDAYMALALIEGDEADRESADGRPRTREFALARLARMIGEDIESITIERLEDFARQIIAAQTEQVTHSLLRQLQPDSALIISGHGNPLAQHVVARLKEHHQFCGSIFWMHEELDPVISRVAPAFAVAWLWEHREAITLDGTGRD